MGAALAVLKRCLVGLVQHHAIGGSLAVFFSSKSAAAQDLDAFALLAPQSRDLISLVPVYEFLKDRGAAEQRVIRIRTCTPWLLFTWAVLARKQQAVCERM